MFSLPVATTNGQKLPPIFLGGNFSSYSSAVCPFVAFTDSNDNLDTAAMTNIGRGFAGRTLAIEILPDDKVLISCAGPLYYNGNSFNGTAVLNPNGTLVTTFGIGFSCIHAQADGKILGIYNTGVIVRYQNNYIQDPIWVQNSANSNVFVIKSTSGNLAIIGGSFTTFASTSVGRIARLTSTGSLDTSFNSGGTGFNSNVRAIAIQSDDKILVGGDFTTYNTSSGYTACNRIIRLNSDGSVDNTFSIGTGFNDAVRSFKILSDGSILVVGSFSTYQGSSYNRLIKLSSTGSIDSSLNIGIGFTGTLAGASPGVDYIEVNSSGDIYLGGVFTAYKGIPRGCVAKISSTGDLYPSVVNIVSDSYNQLMYGIKVLSDNRVVYIGNFNYYNDTNTSAYKLVALNNDGTQSTEFKTFVQHTGQPILGVTDIERYGNNKLLIAGAFNSYNSVSRPGITRILSNGSIDRSFVTTGFGGGTNSSVRCVILSNGKIVASGAFTTYNGVSRNRITGINANGSIDTSFDVGTGFNSSASQFLLREDEKLILAGAFTTYNNVSYNRIISLNVDGSVNGSFDIGTGLSSSPFTIVNYPGNKILIAASKTTTYKGISKDGIFLINSDGSIDNSFNVTVNTAFGSISKVAVQPDGKIVVAGNFDSINSTSLYGITRLNADGSIDNTFNPGLGFQGSDNGNYDVLSSISIQPDGKILLGGRVMSIYNGVIFVNFLRINADGSIDNTFTPRGVGREGILTMLT